MWDAIYKAVGWGFAVWCAVAYTNLLVKDVRDSTREILRETEERLRQQLDRKYDALYERVIRIELVLGSERVNGLWRDKYLPISQRMSNIEFALEGLTQAAAAEKK